MKIRWSEPAIESLRNLHDYIAKDSEIYASSFVQRIILATEKLTNFPRLGRVVPEADEETIRELIYQNYRIIYRIKGEQVDSNRNPG
jgi:toxin ParE1/3/4